MMRAIDPEQIYDAAFDEGLFDTLPGLLAHGFGARSGVMHWSDARAASFGELRHSQYFSDAQLALLDTDFQDEDIWSAAMRGTANRAQRCDDLVSDDTYAHSRLYNEWVRAIGDDSFYGMGAALTVDGIQIEVGLHRARSQGSFDDRSIDGMNRLLGAVRRMVMFRARLAASETRAATIEAALDSSADAVFVLDGKGRPVHANRAAVTMLERPTTVAIRSGVLHGRDVADDRRLQAAIRAATARTGARGSSLSLHADEASDTMSLMPTMIGDQRRIVAFLTTRQEGDRATHFAALHGLSAAEAEIAILLADSHSITEIAARRRTSVMTVRGQVRSILAKTGCARQADIVAAVHTLPRIAY